MASTHAPASTSDRRTTASRRLGYLLAIAVNGALLWVANHLLDWRWPGFLTDEFAAVLWLLSASLVAGMVVNAGFLVDDRGRIRAVGDLVTACFGLAVSIRLWNVFPFDFSGYDTDWSWALRVGLVLGIAGTVIGILANAAKLLRAQGEEPV